MTAPIADVDTPSLPSRGKPRILAITSEIPWPLDTGGHLRTFHILRTLSADFRLRLVAGVQRGQEDGIAALREHRIDVRPAFVGPRFRLREVARALLASARREPYVLYKRHDRRAVCSAVSAEVRREPPDLLYLDHLDSFLFRAVMPNAPCVLDLHNVYSGLVRRSAEEQSRWWIRRYLNREARLLGRIERIAARTADALLSVSEEESRFFASLGARAVHVVPNGVDCAVYENLPTGRSLGTPVILYIGTMSWAPNAAAAHYLAREVLPDVRTQYPDARLVIVGRDPPRDVAALNSLPGVEVTGGVPDVLPYLEAARVLVVPLESGGGTRLKILEAFAAGVPVVSTPVGCEGLEVVRGEHLLISERPQLADGVLSLLRDPLQGYRLAEQARSLVRRRYDWDTVGKGACEAINSVLAAHGESNPRRSATFSVERRGGSDACRTKGEPFVVLDSRVIVGAGGGPEKTILNSPRFLASAGYRNLCLYMHAPGDVGFDVIRRRAAELDAPLVEVDDKGRFDVGIFWRLLKVCRRERVAIWHGHDYKSNLLGLILSRFWRMRLVTTVHGWVQHTSRTPLYYAIDRLCLPRYELVLCVSEDLRESSIRAGVSPERCVLLENGIDLEQYSRRLTTAQAKARFGTPEGRVVLGAVGRLSAEKGFDLLIRAAADLLAKGFDLELWIVGAGDEREALARLAAELNVAERVRLLGFRSDTIDLYQAMDVYVLSSLREGLPNVLLEAMALGVPVVATRVAGVPRLVEDGVNGVLVEAGDFSELSGAVARLLNDKMFQTRIAAAARLTVENSYSFAVRMERVRELYDRLLGRAARR